MGLGLIYNLRHYIEAYHTVRPCSQSFLSIQTLGTQYDTAFGFSPGSSSTVQYTFTHKRYTEQHKEQQNNTKIC